ncbi:MAG TPA: FkbM family methyltransferase [Solirubrobacteraceae bacterium]|nr:FkbM family methyltransferase [Solirubrobacteraceae bacterium]
MRRSITNASLRLVSDLLDRPLAKRIAAMQHTNRAVNYLWTRVSRSLRWHPVPILSGPARGLRINLHGSFVGFATGTAERPLQQAMLQELTPGATFFDIGANVGFITMLAARLVGPSGRVVAFEPVPQNVAAIRENLAMNSIGWAEVREGAVGGGSGEASLIVSDVSAFSRLAAVSVPTGARETIAVAVSSIDDLVSSGAVPPPDVVKIDVEGAELEVIEGMRHTIAEHRPVLLCEVHDCNVAYVELMRSLGYETVNLDEAGVPVELGHRNAHTLARPIASANGRLNGTSAQ